MIVVLHSLLPAFEILPSAQGIQVVDFSVENVPAGHSRQNKEATAMVPALQEVHRDSAGPDIDPLGQAVH